MTTKSFGAEVIADASGKWCGNQMRFGTRDEANEYARDLAWRWTLVTETRVVEMSDPPNYKWKAGRAEHL